MVAILLQPLGRRQLLDNILNQPSLQPSSSNTLTGAQPAVTTIVFTPSEYLATSLDSSPSAPPLGYDVVQTNEVLPVAAVVVPILLGLMILVAIALWYRRRRLLQLSVRELESSILEPFGGANGSTNSRTALVNAPESPQHNRPIWISNLAADDSGRVKMIDEEEDIEEHAEPFRATSSAPMRSISLSTRATLVAPSVVLSERTLVDPVRPHESSTTAPRPGKSPKRRRAPGSRPPPVARRQERSGEDDPLSRLEREQWLERYRRLEEERGLPSPLELPTRDDVRASNGLGIWPSPVTASPSSRLAQEDSETS